MLRAYVNFAVTSTPIVTLEADTVYSLLRDRPFCQKIVVSQEGWSFMREFFTMKKEQMGNHKAVSQEGVVFHEGGLSRGS